MKTSNAIIIIVVLVLLGVFIYVWSGKNNEVVPPPSQDETSTIVGCYVARTDRDVYTLNVQSEEDGNVTGTLAFKNFQKDSSSGTLVGTYQNEILLGDYSFQSEGMNSVMQVIFKKSGDNFVRGYGNLNTEGNKFSDLDSITYDASSTLSLFKKETCPEPTSQEVTLTGEYICLPHRDTTGPQTTECALGLGTGNGLYYALDFNQASQPSVANIKTGDRIRVTGAFTPVNFLSTNQWQKYPIVGILSVTGSVTKI